MDIFIVRKEKSYLIHVRQKKRIYKWLQRPDGNTKTSTMSWVVDFKNGLEEMETSKVSKSWKTHTIYKIPACDKERQKRAFTPEVVSLGPYHCENMELKMQMYDHKRRALHHFVKRSKPLETYVVALQMVLPELMDCYDSLTVKDKETFLQLMLMDGCFVLEILRADKEIVKPEGTYQDYGGVEDPIFSYHGKVYVMPHIRRDMLMLENQLPMLLLVKLVTTQDSQLQEPDKYLNELILKFLIGHDYKLPNDVRGSLHVLDLYRKSLLHLEHKPSQVKQSPLKYYKHAENIVRSAEKLHDSGIKFKKSDTTSLMDIEFDGRTLKLSTIVVDDTTESTFLNLMAFERLHVGAGNEVTSYVAFIDSIVDSAKDVSVLHRKGIIHNAIGSEKVIANLFNGIAKDATPDPENRLQKVHHLLDIYCSRSWNQSCAYLKDTYFQNPWTLVSLLAATLLLLLTAAQTIYAIVGHHHPNDQNSTPPALPPHKLF